MPKAGGRLLPLFGTLLGTVLALVGYLRYSTKCLPLLDTHLATSSPPLSLEPHRFTCLDSLANGSSKKRIAILHGPDWALDSTVELKCFPEREVVMSVEVGRGFLHQPITDRIRFWILKKGDTIYAKIVESTASQELDMDALDLVTNHKCRLQGSENCRVQSAHVIPRID